MSTSNKPTIIGLSGTNGSGKDSIGVGFEKYGYYFVSVTDFLRQELISRNMPIIRENTRRISTEWRQKYGAGYLVEKAIEAWHQNKPAAGGVVMASLRDPGETDAIHKHGGIVIWVDADPKIRYQRIQNNLTNRGRTGEDLVSFDEFLQAEEAEMHPSGDPNATLDMASVKAQADIFLTNDHPNVESFVEYAANELGL